MSHVLLNVLLLLSNALGFTQPEPVSPLGLAVLTAPQGGTGIGSATAGDIGKVLAVTGNSPFTYALTVVSGTGDITNGSSRGTGLNIFDSKSGATLRFNSLSAGTGVTLSTSTNNNTIVISSSASSGSVATSSSETKGQLSYWTSTGATPATLGGVATTSHTFSGPFSVSGTIGALVGGSASTITWNGLATTTQPSSSNLLTSNGGSGVYGTATSSFALTSFPANLSGTLGALVGGSNATFTYYGLATTTALTQGQVLYSTGAGGVSSSATTSVTCTGTVSCTGFNILGSSPITITGSGGGGSFPFSADTNYGQVVYSTSTPTLWFKSGVFASSTSKFDMLQLGSSTPQAYANAPLVISGNTNNVVQSVIQNLNAGSLASGDYIFGGDLMTNTTYYGDLGYNSSGNSDAAYTGLSANAAYFYNSDGELDLATASTTNANAVIKFLTGGALTANERARFTSAGAFAIGLTSPASLFEIKATSTASTGTAFIAWDSGTRNMFQIRNDGFISSASSTPYGQFSINPVATDGAAPSFVIGSSTATNLIVTNAGNIGVGTTTPGTILSIGNTGANTINISSTATSTFGSGINVKTGCFAVNGVCVGSSGTGTVTSITLGGGLDGASPITTTGTITAQVGTSSVPTQGQLAYWTGAGTPSQLGTVATTTFTPSAEFTVGGTIGAFVGGANSTLTLATAGVALTKLATQNANTVLVNQTSAAASPTALATSTFGTGLYGFGSNGNLLAWSNGAPAWVATSSPTSPITWTPAGGYACATCLTQNLSGAVVTSGSSVTTFGSTATANSVLANNTSGAAVPAFIATSSFFGVGYQINGASHLSSFGTTSPYGFVSINPDATLGATPSFVIGSSSQTILAVSNKGYLGLGTTSPNARITFLPSTAAADGIDFGQDVQLYRGGVGTLSATGSFVATGYTIGLTALVGSVSGSGTLYGSLTASQNLTIDSNGSSPKGLILVAPSGGNTGFASSSPWAQLSVNPIATNGNAPAFAVGSSSATAFYIDKASKVYAPNTTSSAATQTGYWCYDASGQFIRDTTTCLVSAAKFKKDVKPLDIGLADFLKIQPVSFFYRDPSFGAGEQMGVIADQVALIDTRLIAYDSNGDIHGFNYEEYTAWITKSIQDFYTEFQALVARVSGLEKRMNDQQKQIDSLQQQINALKK